MTRGVTFHHDATAELKAAAIWYDEQRHGLGLQFLAAVDRSVARIREWPDSGASMPGTLAHLDVRRTPVPKFPYHVVHLLAGDTIHVVALAHDHRRPGYWRDRRP